MTMRSAVVAMTLVGLSACGGGSGGDGGTTGGGTASGGGAAQAGGSAQAGGTSSGFVDDGGVVGSGSRLRVQSLVADGGARHFVGFFDTQRMETCLFQSLGGAGRLVCLPERTMTTTSFSDPSCTLPAGYEYSGGAACDAGTQALLMSAVDVPPGSCAPAPLPKLFRGARATASIGTWYVRASDGGCVGETPDPGRDIIVGAGAEVPLTSFAQAHVERVPRGPLAAVFMVSDDGARQLTGMELADSGVTVSPGNTSDGGGWFLPQAESYVIGSAPDFADPGCTSMPAAYSYSTCAEPGPWAVSFDDVGPCSVTVSVHQRGARYAVDAGFTKTNGVCSPDTTNKKLYALGPVVPLDSFPKVFNGLVGSGEVRQKVLTDAAGRPTEISRKFVTRAGAECEPVLATDGSRVCVDRGVSAQPSPFFSDASCAQALVSVSQQPCRGRPSLPFVVALQPLLPSGSPDFCAPLVARRVLRPFSGSTVYVSQAGSCTGMPATPGDLYETEVVPPAQLERFTLVTE